MQGAEQWFPNYFAYVDRDGAPRRGRLEIARDVMLRKGQADGDFIGAISAAWDDSGPHNETLWLGWAFNAQGSWAPGAALDETVASFMDIYYGPETDGMTGIHQALQQGARFCESTLERLPSKTRPPAYGDSAEKRPVPRKDWAMIPPAKPSPKTLAFKPGFSTRYANAIALAPARLAENERLRMSLRANLTRARQNHYNLEVLLSLADLQRHFIQMLLAVAGAEDLLGQASRLARKGRHEPAVRLLIKAQDNVRASHDDLYATYDRLRRVWEKSRYRKGRSRNGRHFTHVMDDVKDHLADRRPDLTYIISPMENIGLGEWLSTMDGIIDGYVKKHGLGNLRSAVNGPDE